MATWDEAELANEVLRELGIVGRGQTAGAEDTEIVTTAFTSIYPQIRRQGLAPWPAAAISEGAQQPLAKYVAGQVASRFGFSGPSLAEKKLIGEEGRIELQEQAAGDKHTVTPKFKDY